MSETSAPWWRNTWMKAVYASDLKPLEKLVASVYADHARDGRTSWVTLSRMMAFTSLSRDAANRARSGLEEANWLIAQAREPRKPVIFALVIPEGASPPGVPTSTGDGPVTSTGDVLVRAPLVRETDSAGTPREPTSTRGVLHQSSIKEQHQSSSSRTTAQKHLANLLRWSEEDERLDLTNAFLDHHGARKADAYLNAMHRNGDLERLFLAFVKEQQAKADEVGGEDPWAPRGPDVATMLEIIQSHFVDEQSADDRILYDGDAIYGSRDPRPIEELRTDRRVLSSVMGTIDHARKWGNDIPGLRPMPNQEAS